MADPITLTVPEYIAEVARKLALQTGKPTEQILLEHLEKLVLPLPVDVQSEISVFTSLSDDALWTIAREKLTSEMRKRLDELTNKGSHNLISDLEQGELKSLVERLDLLMRRKAMAGTILQRRGYTLTQQDLLTERE